MQANNFIILIVILLCSCSPIKPLITNQYKLTAFSHTIPNQQNKQKRYSIFISIPRAASELQSNNMLYSVKKFALNSFTRNAWIEPPAEMLLPLIIQSLQQSNFFIAVVPSPNNEQTHYRIDSQVLELYQDFLKKPSEIHLLIQVVLSNNRTNTVLASKLFNYHIACPLAAPYGGVIAANQASKLFTQALTSFIIQQIIKDNHHR